MADSQPNTESLIENLRRSAFVKALLISGLVLILQIPVLLIWGLVSERDRTRQTAIADVTDKWGKAQRVYGPFLVVPYRYLHSRTNAEGKETVRELQARATFLPRELKIDGKLATEVRYRGIFEAPVYRAVLQVEGVFDRPEFSQLDVEPVSILWDRAQLVFEVSDARAIQNAVYLRWQENDVPFEPGTGGRESKLSGIHASLEGLLAESQFSFASELQINGSVQLRFAPLGDDTQVTVQGDWPDPSFQGQWLPVDRKIGPAGFTATWRIPHLGRNYPRSWRTGTNEEAIAASQFGLDLLSPVDAYRQTERSLKYQLLFLGLTFAVIWLFEVLGGLRLHVIQYGLIGAAMCIFYLLELSLAEHLGFLVAYTIAAAAVVVLVVSYGLAVLKSRGRAILVGAVLAGLYLCLYVLLQIQDYALLIGALGLFGILAAIMYATRHVEWNTLRVGTPRGG